MKRLIQCFTAAALLTLAAATGAEARTVKFSVSAEPYPPFASKTPSGKWEGFEVDLIWAICKHLPKSDRCKLTATAWDGIIPALTAKKIDVIFASMSITDERKKTIDFTIPYYNTPAAIMARKDSSIAIDPASAKGKTIGVQTATIHENYADKYFKPAGANIKVYNTQDEANSDLAAGRIDATIADSAALDPFLKTDQGKDLAIKGFFPKDDPIWGAGVGAGVRKDDAKLLADLNDAIRAIYRDGTYDKLMKKYFTFDISTPPSS
jgi:polar amino acid transport system substrate-binding protein